MAPITRRQQANEGNIARVIQDKLHDPLIKDQLLSLSLNKSFAECNLGRKALATAPNEDESVKPTAKKPVFRLRKNTQKPKKDEEKKKEVPRKKTVPLKVEPNMEIEKLTELLKAFKPFASKECDGDFEKTEEMKAKFEVFKDKLEAKEDPLYYGKNAINIDAIIFGSFEAGKEFFKKNSLAERRLCSAFCCKVCEDFHTSKAAVIAAHVSKKHILIPLSVETFYDYVTGLCKIKIDEVFFYQCPFCSFRMRSNESEGSFKFCTHLSFAFGYKEKGKDKRDFTAMPNLERIGQIMEQLTEDKIKDILENIFDNRDKSKVSALANKRKK